MNLDKEDYDLQGWWKAHKGKPAPDGHFEDTFKKPNHPTFSRESQYSNADNPGGEWIENPDKTFTFNASAANLKYRDQGTLSKYFAEREKGNKVNFPVANSDDPFAEPENDPFSQPEPQAAPEKSLGRKIYDVTGPAAMMAGGLGGGALGFAAGGPPGAFAGGTLGTMGGAEARRLIGTALGYEEPRTPDEMAKEQLKNAEIGALSELGGPALSAINQGMRGVATPLYSQGVTSGIRSLFGGTPTAGAAADTAATGIPLSMPEQSGSPFAQQVERFLKGAPGSRGVYTKLQERQLDSSMTALDNVVNTIGQRGLDKGTIGASVDRTFSEAVNTAQRARSTQGTADFGFLDTSMGNTAYIPVQTFVDTLKGQVKRLDYVGASTVEKAKANQLNSIINDITSAGGRVTGQAMNNMLSRYSKSMNGGDALFNSITKDASDRFLAGDAFRALDNDLNQAAMQPGLQPHIAEGIATARNNWKLHSEAIQDMQNTVIGRLLNTGTATSEAVYGRLTSMAPTEVRTATQILDGVDPTVMQDVRARYLQDAIEKSSTRQPVVGTNMPERVLDYQAFTRNVTKNPEQFAAMFPNPTTRNQIGAIANQFQRIDSSGKPMSFSYGLLSTTMPGVISIYPLVTGNLPAAAGLAAASAGLYITTKQLAKMLTEPAGRAAWSTLTNQQASRAVSQRALAYVSNYVAQNVIE